MAEHQLGRRRYRRPPIVERVITVHAALDPESFPAKLEGWKAKIHAAFPYARPAVEWDINIEEKEGVPMLASGGPSMHLRNWFWQKPADKQPRGFGLQIDSSRFGINLLRDELKIWDFEDLFQSFEQWFPRWVEHFEVQEVDVLALDYVNLLTPTTVPEFANDSTIRVGDIFKVFTCVSIPGAVMVPPQTCEMNLALDPTVPCFARIGARSAPDGLRVDLQTRAGSAKQRIGTMDVKNRALALHDSMITLFEALFTEEAKASFRPIS